MVVFKKIFITNVSFEIGHPSKNKTFKLPLENRNLNPTTGYVYVTGERGVLGCFHSHCKPFFLI